MVSGTYEHRDWSGEKNIGTFELSKLLKGMVLRTFGQEYILENKDILSDKNILPETIDASLTSNAPGNIRSQNVPEQGGKKIL